jgi:hypothetical protein
MPPPESYDEVFERGIGLAGACTTSDGGSCTAGVEAGEDDLVIVRYRDLETAKTVYTGRPLAAEDFADTTLDGAGDLALLDLQVIRVNRRDGTVQFAGGAKTVVTGSYLEIIAKEGYIVVFASSPPGPPPVPGVYLLRHGQLALSGQDQGAGGARPGGASRQSAGAGARPASPLP